jgi:hypothetical protein
MALRMPGSRENGRRARCAPHEARCRSASARMTEDGETRGLRASISLSTVYLKTPLSSRAGAARARGRGRAAAASHEDNAERDTRCCVHFEPLVPPAAAYLFRGMTGMN